MTKPISSLKNLFSDGFGGIKSNALKMFNGIKTGIKSRIDSVRNTVKSVVSKIKGYFPLKIGNLLSGIKLPHFKITGSFSIKKKTVPHLSIDWYKKGGILDEPTIIGAGEAGREGIIPLEGRYMRPFAKTIAQEMPNGARNNITMNVTVNGAENPEEFATRLVNRLKLEMRTA